MAKMRKYRLPKQIAGVKVPKTLRSTANDMFASPIARELLAAALVHAAATLVSTQSAKGSTTRRLASDLTDAGLQAGKLGSITIGQAVDTLLGYWSKTRSGSHAAANELRERPRKSRKTSKGRKPAVKNRANGTRDAAALH
jgi:hypothetical protein